MKLKMVRQAIEIMENHVIDFIMMDVRMPMMNGIEATRMIKSVGPIRRS